MTKRHALIVVLLVFFALLVAGGLVGMQVLREGGGAAPTRRYLHLLAIDGERAVECSGGIDSSFVLRGVARQGSGLVERWRWEGGAALGSHPWQWVRRGGVLLGELHRSQGEGPARLGVIDVERGVVAVLEDLERGSFAFADEHTAVAVAGGRLRLLDAARADGPAWAAPLQPSHFAVHVAGTPLHAVAWNGVLQVVPRADPSAGRTIGPLTDVVGIAAAREEALVLRDGRLVVHPLAGGGERVVVDLAGGGVPVADGLSDPCLLGRHGGRWLVLYTTTLVHVNSSPTGAWSVPAAQTLAAVDPVSGQVAWRAPLGRWDFRCRDNPFRLELPTDEELPAALLLHGIADVEGGRDARGHLVLLDAATGQTRWEASYDGALRGGSFFTRHGSVVYARLGGVRTDAVLRFDEGRLTAAVRIALTTDVLAAPGTTAQGAWIGGSGWLFLGAPDLGIVAGDGDRAAVTEARAWALDRFGLARAVRP